MKKAECLCLTFEVQEINSMDGVRHRQSYGNIHSAASASGRTTRQNSTFPLLNSSQPARGVTAQQQQSSALRRQQVIQQSQHPRPHPLQHQHSSSALTGGGPGNRRESRETRRSISIPVLGDNRIGGRSLFVIRFSIITCIIELG